MGFKIPKWVGQYLETTSNWNKSPRVIEGAQRLAGLNGIANSLWGNPEDKNAERNIALQREFAQNGIRWKVADAKAAGIHPLYALGANTQSFSPVSFDSGASNAAAMGQDISRVVQAMYTKNEKAAVMQDLQIENQQLQNDMLRSQVRRMNSAGTGPGLPSNSGLEPALVGSGQGDAYVNEVPLKRTHSARPGIEVGHVNDVGFSRTATGIVPVPSTEVKERIEDQFVPETMWAIRNYASPNLGGVDTKPPTNLLTPAERAAGFNDWYWHHGYQEWRPYRKDGGMYMKPKIRRDP